MSGIVKGSGKIFKKVARVVKKVSPIALAAAAAVFTGGAALGLTPTLGAAMGGLTSSLGLSGALGTAVTGALTNAGFGSALGGLVGGKKGMQMGALGGAITGGLLGPGAIGSSAAGAAGGPAAANPMTQIVGGSYGSTGLLGNAGSVLGGASAPATAMGATAATGGITGGLLGNPLVTSNILSGLGQGLMASGQAKENRRERQQIAANYDLGADPFGAGGANQDQYATDASTKWVYDPQQGKLVRSN